ncbi:MAG: protoporphyrinogen oxidase HemJ [Deltaproteobacteria bacterium]|nr:protoporphyrinogen oxidase HemJ [Deltaproteobacteria bacterium]
MESLYQWSRALHIIFMVAWFAGLFYIFRLFVYHAKFKNNSEICQAYSLMERKLLYIIMHPAMLLTIILGIILISLNPAVMKAPWMHAKLTFVVLLIAYQIFAGITHKRFTKGDFFLSEKTCRFINEVPTIALIAIVILVVVRPF